MSHKFSASFAAVLFLFLASGTMAQLRSSLEPVEIRGQVRYARGNAPAENVLVRLESLNGGYVGEDRTDRLGKFVFSRLNPIQYFVSLRYPGFQEIRREVNLVMVASEYLQLQLVPDEAAPAPAPSGFFTKVIDANVPAEARHEYEKGETALLNRKFDEGVTHLEKAVQLYPKFVQAQLRLGTAYMDAKQWDKAEQEVKRALAIDPKVANGHFALGAVYLKQERLDESEKSLLKGLEIENRAWQGHFLLGRTYWTRNSSGDLYKAARQVALTLQLKYDFADAHLLAGNIWMRAQKKTEALFEFQEYLRLAPKGEFVAQTRDMMQKIKMSQGDK